jgi:hypothetical protein
VDEIRKLQHDFNEAEMHADAERLRSLLADDFRSIGERGYVLDKEQWIARFDDFRFLRVETTETTVSRYDRTAIVRAAQHGEATWRGEAITLNVRLSQVWIEQEDGWRLAAIQFSALD